ncbi:MAG: L-serine ammonia-lyase, iron-sulfur-dependent, subunit alpha [Candidatus Bipolaricaulota bacterium]|nr:L-serine ammonia-lyase, iron-sulfur-dependent, subunit alpha [Candidatus Bipolaricaulota bacterium]
MISLKEFLQNEVKPALGCTEPGAVALAVARACQELPNRHEISSVSVAVSDSIYKNGVAVGIPGVVGVKGNAVAAALAVFRGRAEYGLQVLKDTGPSDVERAVRWLRAGRVEIVRCPDRKGVYVKAAVSTPEHRVSCTIEGDHSRIVQVIKDEVVLLAQTKERAVNGKDSSSIPAAMAGLSYAGLLGLVEGMDAEDVDYLMEGVRMNMAIAEYGSAGDFGIGLRGAMQGLLAEGKLEQGLSSRIRTACYAATEARMAGAQLPVMSSAGSGNAGITAIIPVAIAGEEKGKSRREISESLAVSHLTTGFIRARLGRLSPVCGCVVAAGSGAAAGLTHLFGGGWEQAAEAVKLVLANTAGMFCDGAKESCALKVGTAACEAYLAALFAVAGRRIDHPQGVVGASVEQTIENVARINSEGMRDVDRVIIDILKSRDQPS